MTDRYAMRRAELEQEFRRATPDLATRKAEESPSGRFSLEMTEYVQGANSWRYSRGVLTSVNDGQVIADIQRNYSAFWRSWVQHANGNEYLLCGEDYQGQTVVNLTERRIVNYFPESGFGGGGFCWAGAYPSPNSALLAVDGCVWAGPYEVVVMDFREPERLPYREVARLPGMWEWKGWVDDNTFESIVGFDVRKSDGAPFESLSEPEQAAIENDWNLLETRYETRRCTVPSEPQNELPATAV